MHALWASQAKCQQSHEHIKELQLLEHEHYGKIILTESGSDMAKNILDTNKIIYRFLTEILDVDEQTAIAEADLMEHDISKGTRKKLKKFIKIGRQKSADKNQNSSDHKHRIKDGHYRPFFILPV